MIKLILTVLMIACVYAGIQPYRTVQNLTQALENENPAEVDRYVDFDAVKLNFKDDFAKRMGLEETGNNTFAQSLATSIAATFVQGIISPETMVTVLKDKSRRDRMGLSDSFGDLAMRGAFISTGEFVLRNDDNQPTALLTRKGLKWEVTALRIYR